MSRKYIFEQKIYIGGHQCGTEIELKMVVNITVHPGCLATLETPAELPSVDIDSVLFFDGLDPIYLPKRIEDHFTSRDEFKNWVMSEAIDADEYAADQAAHARREALREDLL